MKRTFITLVSTAVLLMAATACYDAIECPDVLRTNDKIKFLPEDNLLTKAPVTTFPTDFGIILSASHSSAGSYMVGIPFSRNSSNEWEPSTAKYWPQSGTLSFLGFAKKNLSVSNVSWNADPSYQVTMTVGDNSSLQEDLMFCAAAAVDKRTTAYPLSFSHAMANLQFTVAAPDGAYNSSNNTGITVSSIKLVNVYNSGTLTATRSGASVSYAWSGLGNQKNLTAPGISNASVATTATALGNGLLVVPQTCVGVQIEYVLHNGKDGNGTAVNTTRTYTYTPSGSWAAGSKYTIAFSISQSQVSATTSISAWTNATQNWIFGTGNTVSWVGSDFSFTSGNLNNIWWRLDGSSSYEPLTYVEGTWGSSVKLESSEYYVTLTATNNQYSVAYETKVPPIDLSFLDINGNNLGTRNTANCYVVKESGRYMIPLVYGNAVKGGVTNAAAYTNNGGTNVGNFVNHLGNTITSPYIENHENCTASSAGLLWQTSRNLVTNVGLYTGTDCKYITFTIDMSKGQYSDGDAVVYVKDTNGNIMWSWLIWITNDELTYYSITSSSGAIYKLLTRDLGAIEYYESGSEDRIKAPLFQWGRKDAFPPTYGYDRDTRRFWTVYDINNNEVTIGYNRNSSNYQNTILNPGTSHYSFSPMANYWNATANNDSYSESSMRNQIKTVYDPCPVDYMIPGLNAFSGGTGWTGYTDFKNGYGGYDYYQSSQYFYPADPQYSAYNGSFSENFQVIRWLFSRRSSSLSYGMGYWWDRWTYQREPSFNAKAQPNIQCAYRVRPCHEYDLPELSRLRVTLEDSGGTIINKAFADFSDGSSTEVTNQSSWSINAAGEVEANYTYAGETSLTASAMPSPTNVRLQAHYITSPFAWSDGVTQGEVTVDVGLAREAYLVYYLQTGAITSRNTMILHTDNTSATNVSDNIYIRTLGEGTAHVSATAACGTIPNQITLNVYDIEYTLEFGGFISQWSYAREYRYNGWENNLSAVWGPWEGPEYDIEYNRNDLDITEEEYSDYYATRELTFGLFMEARAHGSLIFRHACWWIDRTPITVEWSWYDDGNWTSGWIGYWSFTPIGYETSTGMFDSYDDGKGHDGGSLYGSIDIELHSSGYHSSVYMRLGAQLNGAWIYTPSIYIHQEEE